MSTIHQSLQGKRVLYVAMECKPFSKAGGVGDVAGELPRALAKFGCDMHVVTPCYGRIDPKRVGKKEFTYSVMFNGENYEVGVYEGITGSKDGPKVHLIKNSLFFEDAKMPGPGYGKPYINSTEFPYKDDSLRFSFFSAACLPLIRDLNPQIVHGNDWPLGYLFGMMKLDEQHFGNIRRVLTVHNVDYQGNFWTEHARNWSTMASILEHPELGRLFMDPHADWDSVNALRLALELSDVVNTVSPTYAKEITRPTDESKYFVGGRGLESVCEKLQREGRLVGILNGYEYDSEAGSDAAFAKKLDQKAQMRAELQAQFKDPNALLVGFVGRLVGQKAKLLEGDVRDAKGRFQSVFSRLLSTKGINLYLSGSDGDCAEFLESFAETRTNYSCNVSFNPSLAEKIFLGSDVFLMPSLYEPCGITQLASMSNATPPIVRMTGGLADTVKAYQGNGQGTGFVFDGSTNQEVLQNLLDTVQLARDVYLEHPGQFRALQRRAFDARFTWDQSVVEYAKLYEAALSRRP